MKGEIAVTRRATYKAEENVKELESAKEGQDLYIDSLNERIKKLQGDISLSEAQLEAQLKQTDEAKEMLAETGAEMELIAFEKKQLMQQWKSSVIALTRRDEALAAAQKALKDALTSTKDYDTEIDGLKREILKSQAKNETYVNVKDRLEVSNVREGWVRLGCAQAFVAFVAVLPLANSFRSPLRSSPPLSRRRLRPSTLTTTLPASEPSARPFRPASQCSRGR
jgi:outer membrane PBP1 activator LpoA protein